MSRKIIVIGAGASGLMAAAAAASRGASVDIFEKNEKAGKKIYITGKGRGNLSNACPTEEFFLKVASNPKFLYSALYDFDQASATRFFEENGCQVKVERGQRVFPVSDHASDITRALTSYLKKHNVRMHLNTEVRKILTEEEMDTGTDSKNKRTGHVTGILLKDGRKIGADAVILCTGGLSYPSTGSNGAGHRMAEKLGLSLVPCAPSLVPLTVKEGWCRELSGLSLKNVEISVFPLHQEEGKKKKKPLFTHFGEMTFLPDGISGPIILTASCYCRFERYPDGFAMHLNLKPALTHEQVSARLAREFTAHKDQPLKNALRPLFPYKLAEVVAKLSGLGENRKVGSVSEEEREGLADLIQDMPLTLTGTRGYNEAIVTRGGIAVKEINPSTMESRKIGGLYCAGEVLDVDAQTGGFNLQIAWSTGHLAGISAAEGGA